MAKNKPVEGSQVIRAPNHRKFYVTNIVGGLTDQDFRYELLNEKIKNEATNGWGYVSDAMIILSPAGAKRLFEVLKKNLAVWEDEKGVIDAAVKDKHILEAKEE